LPMAGAGTVAGGTGGLLAAIKMAASSLSLPAIIAPAVVATTLTAAVVLPQSPISLRSASQAQTAEPLQTETTAGAGVQPSGPNVVAVPAVQAGASTATTAVQSDAGTSESSGPALEAPAQAVTTADPGPATTLVAPAPQNVAAPPLPVLSTLPVAAPPAVTAPDTTQPLTVN